MPFDWSRVSRVGAVDPPITLALAKSHVGQAEDVDAELIDLYVNAATEWIEGPEGAGVSINQQSWEYYLDDLCGTIRIGLGPLVSVTSITYTDTAGAEQTLATSVYEVDPDRGLIRPKTGQSWPTVDDIYRAAKVTFTAGYASAPNDLKVALLMLVGHLYENREETVAGTAITEVPMGARSIIDRYRRGRFA